MLRYKEAPKNELHDWYSLTKKGRVCGTSQKGLRLLYGELIYNAQIFFFSRGELKCWPHSHPAILRRIDACPL